MAVTIEEQRYGPTTGAGSGWTGVVTAFLVTVVVLLDPSVVHVRVALVSAAVAVLIWCYLLRPRVIIRESSATLLLRNAFSTWHLPLAAVTRVQVKAITRVDAGGKGYDGLGVGRRVRKMVRTPGAPREDPSGRTSLARRADASTPEMVADLVVEQVLAASDRARESGGSGTAVRRTWARLELSVLGVLVLAFAVSYLF